MSRKPAKKEILHSPSAQSVFRCLADCPKWVNFLLLENREYTDFIKKLQDKNFYKEINERTTIKRISSDAGYATSKVTKWLFEMYSDLFTLNAEQPDLFKAQGNRHELYLKNYDNSACFTIWLKSTPRIGETFSCFFLEAKLGAKMYWVEDVYHGFEEEEHRIVIQLKSGFPNIFRQFILDKALFYNEIGFMDALTKHDFEIDKELKLLYKS